MNAKQTKSNNPQQLRFMKDSELKKACVQEPNVQAHPTAPSLDSPLEKEDARGSSGAASCSADFDPSDLRDFALKSLSKKDLAKLKANGGGKVDIEIVNLEYPDQTVSLMWSSALSSVVD